MDEDRRVEQRAACSEEEADYIKDATSARERSRSINGLWYYRSKK